jgi:hypothetical protein
MKPKSSTKQKRCGVRTPNLRSSSALVPKHEQSAGPICGGSLADLEVLLNAIAPVESKAAKATTPPVDNYIMARIKARLASKRAMRRLYKRRKKSGLNAHGKPLVSPNKTNKKSHAGL